MIKKFNITRFVLSYKHLAALTVISGGLVLMSMVVGCGGGSQRGPVSGTVTLDGQPLEHGVISFRPIKGNASPGSGSVVTDGNFEIPADKGLPPGEYKVTISALQKTGRMIQDFPGGPKRPERVPVMTNEADQLEAMIGAGEENAFEFAITTKK